MMEKKSKKIEVLNISGWYLNMAGQHPNFIPRAPYLALGLSPNYPYLA